MAQPPLADQEHNEMLLGTIFVKSTGLNSRGSASDHHKAPTKSEGALPDLLYGALLPMVLVVLVSTSLLAIIFSHQVSIDSGWHTLKAPTSESVSDSSFWNRTLEFKATGGHAAYLIRYNPATLAAIASCTSKIIPFITGSSMAIIAFFAGRHILDASRDHKTGQLPTPRQMSVLIKLLSGTDTSPLWNTLKYQWQNREHLVRPIPLAFGALSFLVVITFLIGAADTWFATTTIPIIQEQLTRHSTPINAYGRGIKSYECAEDSWFQAPCPSNSQAMCNYPCNIETWKLTTARGVALKEGIKRAQESAETLLGNSNTNVIQNVSSQAYGHKNGAQQYRFLADAKSGQDLDFVANTIAVTTQCEVVTQDCQLNLNSPGFSCFGYESPSFTYSGKVGIDPTASMVPDNVTMNNVGIQFFKDSGLQNPIGFGNQTTKLFVAQNPAHFLTWSKGFPPVDTSTTQYDEMRQNKFLQLDPSGDNVFVLNCSFSVYNATYAWVNGTILHHNQKAAFDPLLAPDIYGAIFGAPFAMNSALGQLSLENAAALAAYKRNPQDLSNRFADEFSRAAVALSSGITSPVKNLLEQSRNNAEVLTRVPKVPFYLLISLQALYALGCLILASLAYVLTGIYEAQEVKTRLTVDGLVAGLFEPDAMQEQAVDKIEELCEEQENEESQAVGQDDGNTKVGIKKTETEGWIWFRTGKVQKA